MAGIVEFCPKTMLTFPFTNIVTFRVEEYFIDTKSAENRRKKQYPSFVISCQISFKVFHIFVHKLKTKLRYRLSANSRATRIVF